MPSYRLVDPCEPSVGETRALGAEFTVEIWIALGQSRPEEELAPLSFASSSILGPTGETFFGTRRRVTEADPGESITLQLRVWENQAGTLSSWSSAIASRTAASGKSVIIGNYELGGLRSYGTFIYAESMFTGMSPITISAVCPEPSSYLLLALGAGCGLLMRLRSAGGTTRARAQY